MVKNGDNSIVVSYEYDGIGRLIRENVNANKTVLYDHDCGGNLLSKKEYAYSNSPTVTVKQRVLNKIYIYEYSGANRDWRMKFSGQHSERDGDMAAINPFCYRGYYYDAETGLFYTPGRYYDPEVGRWINADDIAYLNPETIGGINLYAYSLNNPVMYYDPTGNFAISIFLAFVIGGLIAGAVIGGTVGGIAAYNLAAETGATGWELFGWTVLGIFGGAVIGGTIGAVAGATIGGLATGAAAFGAMIGGGGLALAGGGILGGGAALATVSIGTAIAIGVGINTIFQIDVCIITGCFMTN